MGFALDNSPHEPLSVYQVSFNSLVYFQRYAPDKSVKDGGMYGQMDGWTDKAATICSPFGEHKYGTYLKQP